MIRFQDRSQAGNLLADRLKNYGGRHDVIVLALPRGGVPVAYEIAKALHVPLDISTVRKLGMPGHEELAIGAIASGGVKILNDEILQYYTADKTAFQQVIGKEFKELKRREQAYRGNKPPPVIKNKTVIIVDDGVATGASMRAAIQALRQQFPDKIIVATPVAPGTVEEDLPDADEVVCLLTPEPFRAVGLHYINFEQTSDEEVRELLQKAESFAAKETQYK